MNQDIPSWADSLRRLKPANYSGDIGEVFYRAGYEAARTQLALDATLSGVPSHGSPVRFVHRQVGIAACVAALLAGPIGFGIGQRDRSPETHLDLATSEPVNKQLDTAGNQPRPILATASTAPPEPHSADIVMTSPARSLPVVSNRNDGRQTLVAFHRRIPMDSNGRLHWDDGDSLLSLDASPARADLVPPSDLTLETKRATQSLLTAGDLLSVTRSLETAR